MGSSANSEGIQIPRYSFPYTKFLLLNEPKVNIGGPRTIGGSSHGIDVGLGGIHRMYCIYIYLYFFRGGWVGVVGLWTRVASKFCSFTKRVWGGIWPHFSSPEAFFPSLWARLKKAIFNSGVKWRGGEWPSLIISENPLTFN